MILKTAFALSVPREFLYAQAGGNYSARNGTGRADAELKNSICHVSAQRISVRPSGQKLLCRKWYWQGGCGT